MQLSDVLKVITVEDVLVSALEDPYTRDQTRHIAPGSFFTVTYQFGEFRLTAEEAPDMAATLRLRGKVPSP